MSTMETRDSGYKYGGGVIRNNNIVSPNSNLTFIGNEIHIVGWQSH